MTDTYPLTTEIERCAAYYAATAPTFYAHIGHAIDPDRMSDLASRNLMKAVRQIGLETGRGPSKAIIPIQRLRRFVDDGKMTYDELVACSDLIDTIEDDPQNTPDHSEVMDEIVPVLRRVLEQQAALSAADDYSNRRDFDRTVSLIERARSLGAVNTSLGLTMGADSEAAIAQLNTVPRLTTGVPELDQKIRGGLRRGCFGMWLGSSGAGKSIALNHVSATALCLGMNVAYATLELPPEDVFSRTIAAMVGVPIDDVIADSSGAHKTLSTMTRGGFWVNEFEPLVTTFPDVAAWVESLEEHTGIEVDVLITDYGDKLGSPKKAKKSDDESSYRTGLHVFEAMRRWARKKDKWHWSASQSTRRKQGKKQLLDIDDTADSMHKVRVTDLLVSINLDEENDELKLKVGKGRFGGTGAVVEGLVPDFAYGRLVMPLRPSMGA